MDANAYSGGNVATVRILDTDFQKHMKTPDLCTKIQYREVHSLGWEHLHRARHLALI